MTTVFGEYAHAKRLESIANASAGVLHAASCAIHAIGAACAMLSAGQTKHDIKQVDRLLSNEGFDVWGLFEPWVRFVIAEREEIVVALDWTDFEKDGHTTLCAYLVTRHGRATPLAWKTVPKSTLEGKRKDHEYALVERLHAVMPPAVRVVRLADRGFGDQKLYVLLGALGALGALGGDYVIRFRECILVEDERGVCQPASAWVGAGRGGSRSGWLSARPGRKLRIFAAGDDVTSSQAARRLAGLS